MFFWKRRNDGLIVELLTKVLERQAHMEERLIKMVNVSNGKLDQIKATLITAGAGVNTLIANNENFAKALEEARSNGVDVAKLDEVFAVSTGIAATVAAALNPTVATPPVEELPIVQPSTESPDLGVTPVPTTEDPIADLPSEAPVADAPSETPATDVPSTDAPATDGSTTDTGTGSDTTTS